MLWVDDDLAEEHDRADAVENDRKRLLLDPSVLAANKEDVQAALELANAIAQAETDRETNLNARGAAVASVAALVVSISAAVAKSVFATDSDWSGRTRNATEWLFLAALVVVSAAMVIAVASVLRPSRGGRTKNSVGEAVLNVWRQPDGDIALAAAGERGVAVFWLDRLLRALPAWHYRNRSKARSLRRAWMLLMLGTILIASAGVLVLAELPPQAQDASAQAQEASAQAQEASAATSDAEMTWTEIVSVVALTSLAVWISLKFNLVLAGRRPPKKERDAADEEAVKIASLLGPSLTQSTSDESNSSAYPLAHRQQIETAEPSRGDAS